jgi:hypothetical protein
MNWRGPKIALRCCKRYNDTLRDFNTYIRQFPNNIIAGWAGFKPNEAYFAASEGSKKVPKNEFLEPVVGAAAESAAGTGSIESAEKALGAPPVHV